MARQRKRLLWLLAALLPLPFAYGLRDVDNEPNPESVAAVTIVPLPRADGMVRLPESVFLMGTPRPGPADQRPVHRVRLKSFWLDRNAVTNREFEAFVAATDYTTTAEQQGWSLLFDRNRARWNETEGVSWRHPTGADSSLVGKAEYPVVHVSWSDAVAYAAWAGKRLPTEAEFEFASRGGLSDTAYAWGRELTLSNRLQANYWQGKFPFTNLQLDGFYGVSPVESFSANSYGLFDMAGNVACWCADWYADDAYGSSRAGTGDGPTTGTERVLRGGSWRSTSEKGNGLQVGDREHAAPTTTSDYIGFRCARDVKE